MAARDFTEEHRIFRRQQTLNVISCLLFVSLSQRGFQLLSIGFYAGTPARHCMLHRRRGKSGNADPVIHFTPFFVFCIPAFGRLRRPMRASAAVSPRRAGSCCCAGVSSLASVSSPNSRCFQDRLINLIFLEIFFSRRYQVPRRWLSLNSAQFLKKKTVFISSEF